MHCWITFSYSLGILNVYTRHSIGKKDEKNFKRCWDDRFFCCWQRIMLDCYIFLISTLFWDNKWYQILKY